METRSPTPRFEPVIREWAVRTASIEMKEGDPARVIASVAQRTGCTEATLRRWMRDAERAGGIRPGVFTKPQRRVRELEAQLAALREDHARLRLDAHRRGTAPLIIGGPPSNPCQGGSSANTGTPRPPATAATQLRAAFCD